MQPQEIYKLLLFFIIYSFLGWLLETVAKSIEQKKFINSGFLVGPLCPIYGFGAFIMLIFLDRFKENYLLLFFMGMVILTAWEYLVGIILEKAFKTKYWDYSNYKINFQGRICLVHSTIWGILGVIFIRFIHPYVIEFINIIDIKYIIMIDALLYMILVIDCIYSIIKATNIRSKIIKLREITETLKEKLEEINVADSKKKTKEKLKQIIDELKENQNELIEKLQTQTERIRKAFPTMKMEINDFLNKKIHIIKKGQKKEK